MTRITPSKLVAASLCALAGLAAGWTLKGWRQSGTIADLQRTAAQRDATVAGQLADAAGRVRALEHVVRNTLDNRNEALKQETIHAKIDRNRFIANVRTGAVRVSIPVAGTCADNSAMADHPAPAERPGEQTRAELDREAAATLETIAGDGDDATSQLNACIDVYNSVRDKYNVQTQ